MELKVEPIEREIKKKLDDAYIYIATAATMAITFPLRKPIFNSLSKAKQKIQEVIEGLGV